MSLYLVRNGEKQKIQIPANDVTLLDIEENYKSKNLEEVMKEVKEEVKDKIQSIENIANKNTENISNLLPTINQNKEDVSNLKESVDKNSTDLNGISDRINNNTNNIAKNTSDIETLRKGMSSLGDINSLLSNPNYLINGDFRIRQRAFSDTITSNGDYYYDRWRMYTPKNTTAKLNTSEDCLSIIGTGSAKQVTIVQYLDLPQAKQLADGNDRKITVTVRTKQPTNKMIKMWFTFTEDPIFGTSEKPVTKNFSCSSILSDTFTFTSVVSLKNPSIAFGFSIDVSSPESGSIDIVNVKLESGSTATPFVSRPYEKELKLCQRYYYKNEEYKEGTIIRGDKDGLRCCLPIPGMMGDPNLKFRDDSGLKMQILTSTGSWINTDLTKWTCVSRSYQELHLQYETTDSSLSEYKEYSLRGIPDFDAELYPSI